jgi:hypothetical protein
MKELMGVIAFLLIVVALGIAARDFLQAAL